MSSRPESFPIVRGYVPTSSSSHGLVRQPRALDPVAQRARRDDDTDPPHRGQAATPVAVPHRRVLCARDAGAEPDPLIDLPRNRADCASKLVRIVVGMVVAERILRVPVKILPVDEGNSALDVGLGGNALLKQNNSTGATRRGQRGAIAHHRRLPQTLAVNARTWHEVGGGALRFNTERKFRTSARHGAPHSTRPDLACVA